MSVSAPTDQPPSTFREPWGVWRVLQALSGVGGTHLPDVPPVDLKGKWVIISGATSGIGYESAKYFATCGANLILACRQPDEWEKHPKDVIEECISISMAAQPAAAAADDPASSPPSSISSPTIEWWDIDMAQLKTVNAFADRWLETGRPLHILCNNAGTASRNDFRLTEDGFEFIHQVNFLSHVLLTIRLLPSLAKSPEPRVVCSTSCFHFLGNFDMEHFNSERGMKGKPYPNNKLYFQMWVAELQRRLLKHDGYKHITINGVHPGYVKSGIWNSISAKERASFIGSILPTLVSYFGITPEQGSISIIHVATSDEHGPDPKVQGVGVEGGKGGGRYINRIWDAEPMPHCHDASLCLRLWTRVATDLQLEEMRQL